MRAPQFFRIGTGHQVAGNYPWQLQRPRKSASRGSRVSTTRSFALATALMVARPPGLIRPERLCVHSASQGFYFRAFRSPGRPDYLPDITTASN